MDINKRKEELAFTPTLPEKWLRKHPQLLVAGTFFLMSALVIYSWLEPDTSQTLKVSVLFAAVGVVGFIRHTAKKFN